MRYPVHPVALPADLRGINNGKLPATLLAPIQPHGQLHRVAARAWNAMRQAAAQDGVELSHVGAMRTYDQQVALFRERYQTAPNGSRVTRKWNGRSYYLRPGYAPSATPGTSNHGWGLAIDVANASEAGRHRWLLEHAVSYGFSWEVADPDNPNFEVWHLRYFVGDATPPAMLPSTPAPVHKPTPITRTLRRGDTGDDVRTLQWALVDAAYAIEGAGNGTFGPRTDAAVRAFQQHQGLTVDGIVGPKTRAALGL